MSFLKVGQIVNIHGLKGEVKIYPYTDDIENLSKIRTIYLNENGENKYKIKQLRVHKNMLIAKLEYINSIEEAQSILNSYIYITKQKIKEDDVYYVEDLLNLDIYELDENLNFENAKLFGKLIDILKPGANDVYEVLDLNNKKIYLPVIKDVVKKIDIDNKKIYVKIMEGLI